MQESLETLERERDGPGDEVLAAMVRLQLMGDEAHKLLLRDVAAAGAVAMGGEPSTETPSYVFRKNMVERLQSIKEKISPEAGSSCKRILFHFPNVVILTRPQMSSKRITTSPRSSFSSLASSSLACRISRASTQCMRVSAPCAPGTRFGSLSRSSTSPVSPSPSTRSSRRRRSRCTGSQRRTIQLGTRSCCETRQTCSLSWTGRRRGLKRSRGYTRRSQEKTAKRFGPRLSRSCETSRRRGSPRWHSV